MTVRAAEFGRVAWRALDKFFADNCPGLAAALSFFTVFTLPALLTLLLMLVGLVADPRAVQAAILAQIESLIGPAGAAQVGQVITNVRDSRMEPTLTGSGVRPERGAIEFVEQERVVETAPDR